MFFVKKVGKCFLILGLSDDDVLIDLIGIEDMDRLAGDVHEKISKIYSIVSRL